MDDQVSPSENVWAGCPVNGSLIQFVLSLAQFQTDGEGAVLCSRLIDPRKVLTFAG
ncbi:hypothetical protein [Bradyrhizobium australiense]|uniref:Uncharacterized protein n=1 Tax=Bradyrhizobium australiense TaxID=2721161 RepID=A0A7Y4LVT4_9BRAD|nr:hypothetical protein [Bradyrhizobium australiense]NOJ39990.1 hypothetical protein [Bradyrhizobium australiense]